MEKKFFIEKNINENVKKNISHFRNIFLHRKCLLQTKYKSFLNIYSFIHYSIFNDPLFENSLPVKLSFPLEQPKKIHFRSISKIEALIFPSFGKI